MLGAAGREHSNRRLLRPALLPLAPTPLAAILHLIPYPFPLLPPVKGAAAGGADLLRELFLFHG